MTQRPHLGLGGDLVSPDKTLLRDVRTRDARARLRIRRDTGDARNGSFIARLRHLPAGRQADGAGHRDGQVPAGHAAP